MSRNDADFVQFARSPGDVPAQRATLIAFGLSTFRVFGGAVALGALVFTLIDPTVAAQLASGDDRSSVAILR